jgi:hypothetical protein
MVGTDRYPSSQAPLPKGNSGIDEHVLFALDAVSLLYLWWTVNLNGTTNHDLVFGFSFAISADFILIGQFVLFSVFGLMP